MECQYRHSWGVFIITILLATLELSKNDNILAMKVYFEVLRHKKTSKIDFDFSHSISSHNSVFKGPLSPDSYCNYVFIQTFFFTFSHYNYFFSLSREQSKVEEVWRHFYYVFFILSSFTILLYPIMLLAFGLSPISCQCLKMIIMDFSLWVLLLKARYYQPTIA